MNFYLRIKTIMLCLLLSTNFVKINLTKSKGFLIFDSYGLCFIKTQEKDIVKLLAKNDTIKIILLGTPGDNSNDLSGFKEYLSKVIVFNTVICRRASEDFQGKPVEYRDTMIYKEGYIYYYEDNGYNLAKRFDKIVYNEKTTVFEIEPFVPIERFEADDSKK